MLHTQVTVSCVLLRKRAVVTATFDERVESVSYIHTAVAEPAEVCMCRKVSCF